MESVTYDCEPTRLIRPISSNRHITNSSDRISSLIKPYQADDFILDDCRKPWKNSKSRKGFFTNLRSRLSLNFNKISRSKDRSKKIIENSNNVNVVSRCQSERLPRRNVTQSSSFNFSPLTPDKERLDAIISNPSKKQSIATSKNIPHVFCKEKNKKSFSCISQEESSTSKSEEDENLGKEFHATTGSNFLSPNEEYGHASAIPQSEALLDTENCSHITQNSSTDRVSVIERNFSDKNNLSDDNSYSEQSLSVQEMYELCNVSGINVTQQQIQEPSLKMQPVIVQSSLQPVYDQVKEPQKTWSLTKELFRLSKFGWYWGPINRIEAEQKLFKQPDGAFLVRDSSDERYLLSLSFRSFRHTLHTRIEHCNGVFSFYAQPESEGYNSIVDLIEHSMTDSESGVFCYSRARAPDSPSFPVRLTKPISRFTQIRSLQYLCRFVIRQSTRLDHIKVLPLPLRLIGWLEENQY